MGLGLARTKSLIVSKLRLEHSLGLTFFKSLLRSSKIIVAVYVTQTRGRVSNRHLTRCGLTDELAQIEPGLLAWQLLGTRCFTNVIDRRCHVVAQHSVSACGMELRIHRLIRV